MKKSRFRAHFLQKPNNIHFTLLTAKHNRYAIKFLKNIINKVKLTIASSHGVLFLMTMQSIFCCVIPATNLRSTYQRVRTHPMYEDDMSSVFV